MTGREKLAIKTKVYGDSLWSVRKNSKKFSSRKAKVRLDWDQPYLLAKAHLIHSVFGYLYRQGLVPINSSSLKGKELKRGPKHICKLLSSRTNVAQGKNKGPGLSGKP